MADSLGAATASAASPVFEEATYELLRQRLDAAAADLAQRLEKLNVERRRVFGSIETRLIATERITTENNCIPCDMVALGDQFVFGYNVHLGLRSEVQLADVFSVHGFQDNTFFARPLDLIRDELFENDFRQLYKYYRKTVFYRFFVRSPHLYMVFQVGKTHRDIKAFKWLIDGSKLKYVDNRSEYEISLPPQHEFEWIRTHRDLHRSGQHPHISIQDRIFVETIGGDLTIKVEDNTDEGQGIYSEPVDDPDQVLDDAEIFYATVGNLILLKVRPYREERVRYLVYNEKTRQARRLDAVAQACVLLPQGHGLVFSNGYYLQTGEYKLFEEELAGLNFERRIASAHGEDDLFVFFNPEHGDYVLLSYNRIEQRVEIPLVCRGYCIFPNGRLVLFKATPEPEQHHALQIWQTPYTGSSEIADADTSSLLYKVGKRDVVRAMAACHEILQLSRKDTSYANLYADLSKKSGDVLDAFFWLQQEAAEGVAEPLKVLRDTALAAIQEFDKVQRQRRETEAAVKRVERATEEALDEITHRRYEVVDDFVQGLATLRRLRGEAISLRDLKYVDLPRTQSLEAGIDTKSTELAERCVAFLLHPGALQPYETRISTIASGIEGQPTVSALAGSQEQLQQCGRDLELLIEIVSNLRIDDATQRTEIIDAISAILAKLNQVRAVAQRRRQELMEREGAAEFHAQLKLLGQTVVSYLDICDSPARCDEYLTKVMVQVEELEGRFAEFTHYLPQLAEKRDEIYSAFDGRRMALAEARSQRAAGLVAAADRILKGIQTRVQQFKTVEEIQAYFVADLMVEKVRSIVAQLAELEESVKIDDIQSRLKTAREDAVRQLRDRQDLYVGNGELIKLGRHQFTVNTQPLDLTTMVRDGAMVFHITGTDYVEPIEDEALSGWRDLWSCEVGSESVQVYRAEYLAYLLQQEWRQLAAADRRLWLNGEVPLLQRVQQFMAPRYQEGYLKGVHDQDATRILQALLSMEEALGVLRILPRARALAMLYWELGEESERREQLAMLIAAAGEMERLYGDRLAAQTYQEMLAERMSVAWRAFGLVEEQTHLDEETSPQRIRAEQRLASLSAGSAPARGTANEQEKAVARWAAEYLYHELAEGHGFHASQQAVQLTREFLGNLERRQRRGEYTASCEAVRTAPGELFVIVRHWIVAFAFRELPALLDFVDEAAVLLITQQIEQRRVVDVSTLVKLTEMLGSHARVPQGELTLDYYDFEQRLPQFVTQHVRRFEQYIHRKQELLEAARRRLRLEEFKPKVLTSFVRNQLVNEVYLPMIGENLAKQLGVAGEQKRTDRMGLLLLISPPGYGKTTLMEYVANRLGLTFVKINGPALGHRVTSLDPQEAPNANAAEEIKRLNLAFQMGDNVMIYIDDIQHCHPEFLQKFISLCDAQRKVEGVFQGQPRTFDLRGRKVAIVMAGNPYTESGEKFQIPDMLANRADTYNLGDVIGSHRGAFELSYLENAAGSNPALALLANRHPGDIGVLVRMVSESSADASQLQGSYTPEELQDLMTTLRKLLRVRAVILKVNQQYIESAAQADAYRTEPPFKLQGSYRDMNKIAERVVPIMNDQELEELIYSHYQNQSQTLTQDAEANMLKFKEMAGTLRQEEAVRWTSIKEQFLRNKLLGGASADDPWARVTAQIQLLTDGLQAIESALVQGIQSQREQSLKNAAEQPATEQPVAENAAGREVRTPGGPTSLAETTGRALGSSQPSGDVQRPTVREQPLEVARAAEGAARPNSPAEGRKSWDIRIVNRVPNAFLEVIRAQHELLRAWMLQMRGASINWPAEGVQKLLEAADKADQDYVRLNQQLSARLELDEPTEKE